MKITIPTHIKELLERMADEFETQYAEKKDRHNNGEAYCKIEGSNGKIYINEECDLYMAECIKDFEVALDKQEVELFQKEDEYSIKKEIVFYIKSYLGELPLKSYYNVYREVSCDEKLEKVMRKRKFKEDGIREEVKNLKKFIENRKSASWSQDDAYVDSSIFEFVSTEQDFEKVLRDKKCEELTPGYKEKFEKVRIAFLEKTERDIYEEKGLLDEVERFYDDHIQNNNIGSDLETFDMWHNIKRTGIYYVFVPVK